MELSYIKNKKDFISYMEPYGNHVEFIIGNYYSIRKGNNSGSCDIFEIKKYSEEYYKKNTKRLVHGCEPIEIKIAGSEECVKLILGQYIKQQRKLKLERINESI